ncbi:Zn-ribbon domain-containing OB-fold protein [Haloarcula nitratireducens]|uniref:OB-fold domain-containing protein n=1 Tax=Haloarcula nitratireducens TaxID=2487749 RepID=A0AAW4PKC7_9EURY|nr:OB-fold domain-containing protein [Halomicroarcula nitratireducens]MBX0297820.1 OB-fold domain-containing protein [Halomicroarcula nitratireducens]
MPAWFDDFTDAIAAGEHQCLVCEACGDATLPPRKFCPACGSTALTEKPLPDRGEILSYTEISVTIPKFHGETPYTVVLVELEDVDLTGQLREATAEDIALGDEVILNTEPHDDDVSLITFRPAEV